MHRCGVLAVVLWSVSGPALAAGEGWRGEVLLDVPVGFTPRPTLFSGLLTGTWFIEPLAEDGTTPLGLLSFVQHPDTVSLALSGFAGPGATLSATFYPWRNTGFTASASVEVATDLTTVGGGVSAGVTQYLSQSLRLELLYLGTRGKSGELFGTSVNVADSSDDSGRLAATLLVGQSARLTLAGEVGGNSIATSAITASSSGTVLTTTSYRGLSWRGSASITGYVGRHFSAGFSAAAGGQVPLANRGLSVTQTLALSGGPTLDYFIGQRVFVRAGYEATLTLIPRPTTTAALGSRVILSVGGRF